MQQVYRYKDFVDKEGIVFKGDIKNNFRYLLRIPLKNYGNRKVVVIMKNPSKANAQFSDLTVDRVLTFCNSEGYSEVNILNMYSFYSTVSGKIAELIRSGKIETAIGKDNDNVLKSILSEVEHVIVAWGSNTFGCTMEYKNRIRQIIDLIKEKNLYYVEECGGEGWYPRHAQVWSVNSDIKKYKWTIPKLN
jgi:hypothetical protein